MARAGREHVILVQSVFEARSPRFTCAVISLPSAVLTTLRIAEGRYGTREVILQDLASNALKGNVLS